MEGYSFLDQFSLRPPVTNYNIILSEEISNIKSKLETNNLYPISKTEDITVNFMSTKLLPLNFSVEFTDIFYIILGVIKKLGYIFIFIGLAYSIYISKKKEEINQLVISLIGTVFFLLVVLITVIPLGSVSYSVLRTYQQGLILFSLFCLMGLYLIFSKTKNYTILLTISFLLIYFAAFNGIANQIVGGNTAFSNLNNLYDSYNPDYYTFTETSSISWLSKENINGKVYAGRNYMSIFNIFSTNINPDFNIFPQTIERTSYVYAGNSEIFFNTGFSYINELSLGFNFPKMFLNNNKNKIYNNGGSEIFK
jgi:hypothetical protein